MAEYINTESTYDIDTLEDWYINSVMPNDTPVWTEEHLEELLNDFYVIPKDTPTADVEPVRHGHWRKLPHGRYNCSNCHCIVNHEEQYCEFCGAKMDVEELDNGKK